MENPALWVICDSNGNWSRIQNRLKTQNLKFEGSKVYISLIYLRFSYFQKVPSASAAYPAVEELMASLRYEYPNISPDFSLPKALGYNELMKSLEDRGLVAPVPPLSKNKSKNQVKSTNQLAKAHSDKVVV